MCIERQGDRGIDTLLLVCVALRAANENEKKHTVHSGLRVIDDGSIRACIAKDIQLAYARVTPHNCFFVLSVNVLN